MIEAIAVLNTNTKTDSVQEITLGCTELWSIGQQEAMRRLSRQRTCALTRTQRQELVCDFSARAARIAATYACFYLETEHGCNPKYKGRFYWMGLAAFASKQVKCALDFVAIASLHPLGKAATHISKDALGKGNFWLFQDIFVWHWFYSHYPEQFFECSAQRDARNMTAAVKRNMESLPWARDALEVLNNLRLTDELVGAFKCIQDYEDAANSRLKQHLQMRSLLLIANHEQLNVLQPLIYDNWQFKRTLDMQALLEGVPLLPKRIASFSAACDVSDESLRVQMKEGDLYDAVNRMEFIRNVATHYHFLMNTRSEYMEETMRYIASWKSTS